MPLVKLTIRDEPFEVPDDEVETLRAQGLLEDDPAKPEPPKPTLPPPAAEIKKD
jgi:hypothetical protein